jgi:hypothetical protein
VTLAVGQYEEDVKVRVIERKEFFGHGYLALHPNLTDYI